MSILGSLFGSKRDKKSADKFTTMQGELDGHPLFAEINMAYATYTAKSRYPWFLGVTIPLIQPNDEGLPTNADIENLEDFESALKSSLRAACACHYIGRVTWNGNRELLFYVDNFDIASNAIKASVTNGKTRSFMFKGRQDENWTVADKYLK